MLFVIAGAAIIVRIIMAAVICFFIKVLFLQGWKIKACLKRMLYAQFQFGAALP